MDLVIDANVLFSALISKADTHDLLFSDDICLFAPEFLLTELEKYREEILIKSKLSTADLDLAIATMTSRIRLLPFEEFQHFIKKASAASPDEKDTEYFAVALKLHCPIWSNDKKLKSQKEVKVMSTNELLKKLRVPKTP